MSLRVKISFEEYLRLLYILMYSQPLLIFIVLVDLVLLGWIIGYYQKLLPVSEPSYFQFITVAIITILQPLGIFYVIWRNYHSSSHLREPLEIQFTPTIIKVWGDSFYTELKWEKIFKVEELNNWFLIYQNNLSAVIIPKKVFSETQCDEFIALLDVIPSHVPVHLKEKKKR
jgi:hypothetical protein